MRVVDLKTSADDAINAEETKENAGKNKRSAYLLVYFIL